MKLYVRDIDNYDISSPRSFLLNYFINRNSSTYYDKDCNDYQCAFAKGRSFSDLFRLTKTYFPDIKLDEFAYVFIDIMKKDADYPYEIIDNREDYDGWTMGDDGDEINKV